jgi:4-amino-4-deoxy-L-arabinose transferase-like glycosyltransferase
MPPPVDAPSAQPPTRRRSSWRERAPLLAVLLLAALLRVPGLDALPPGLHPDEAANAADALDLSRGQGAALAYAHERGGWVEGTYVWLAAPAFWLPVEPETAVRLPAAASGVLAVLAVYLLGARLGDRRLGLLAALLLATAPWGYHHARLALRASLLPALVVGGLAAWERDRRQPSAQAGALGALLLGGAALTYPPARLVVPLLATAWLAISRTPARRAAALLGPVWLVFWVLLPWTLSGPGSQRLVELSVLDRGAGVGPSTYAALRGYALHFTTRHLFSGATSRGFAPEGVGLLPLWTAPLLLAGLVALISRRDRACWLLGAWLLLHPLSAAFTRDVPSALRANLGLPALALLGGLGGTALLDRLGPSRRRAALAAACVTMAVAGCAGAWTYARVTRQPHQAAFYYAGRREIVREAARSGEVTHLRGEFWEAYLRLYAPTLPRDREPGGWVVGDTARE